MLHCVAEVKAVVLPLIETEVMAPGRVVAHPVKTLAGVVNAAKVVPSRARERARRDRWVDEVRVNMIE